MEASLADARASGGLVGGLTERTRAAQIAGDWEPRAERIVKSTVVPAPERQFAVMQAQRPQATMDAGLWARPGGAAWYALGLPASPTTPMPPAVVHRLGQHQLPELQGR